MLPGSDVLVIKIKIKWKIKKLFTFIAISIF